MKKKELSWTEIKESIAELRASQKETSQQIKETSRQIDNLHEEISGISNSNGLFAEEYFFNSLEKKMEFAGVHFDSISNEFRRLRKTPDGGRVEDQFDIVLFNGNAIALIEVKYKARKKNLDKMLKQKIPNFRFLFPEYAKHKIYLGLGGMSFEKNVVGEAKKLGIGLLKQVGETIEYETEWVKAY
ncbi:MAG: hypothetical protein LBH25_09890 [Fibromonadaceae bacterium]|jgi:hypothetical protein|nr:hypothetical protein [Fibromonadaceae bacterium]